MQYVRRVGAALVISAVALSVASCTWVNAVPVEPGSSVSGIRIPEVKPLLVVSGSQVSVMLVPNPNKTTAVQFGAFLAKHELKLDIQNGMLASIDSNQDSTAVPVAFLAALQQAAATGHNLGAAFSGSVGATSTRLQVYDIVFDDYGNLLELRPLVRARDLIRVPATGGVSANVPTPNATPAPTPNPTPAPSKPVPGKS